MGSKVEKRNYIFLYKLVDEFVLMSKLKENFNIVSYGYYSVVPKENSFVWNIYIGIEGEFVIFFI